MEKNASSPFWEFVERLPFTRTEKKIRTDGIKLINISLQLRFRLAYIFPLQACSSAEGP